MSLLWKSALLVSNRVEINLLIKIFQEKASIMFPTLTSAKAIGLCIPNEISIFAGKGLIV